MDRVLSLVFFIVLLVIGLEAFLHIVEHVQVLRRLDRMYRLPATNAEEAPE